MKYHKEERNLVLRKPWMIDEVLALIEERRNEFKIIKHQRKKGKMGDIN